jgi:hypothetical protein
MLGKPKLPFFVHDPQRLDLGFYSDYDERFLYRKVTLLRVALQNPDLLTDVFGEEQSSDERERIRHALAAELLFTELHQFESFFAILIACFQELPHWIFLTTYSTGEIKDKAKAFVQGGFGALAGGLATDRDSFLRIAVYNGLGADDADQESWRTTFENLWWLIRRMAQKYLAATEEYNSYKHGLRIISATSYLAVAKSKTDLASAHVLAARHSITHLRLDKEDTGTAVSVETKEFNPEESSVHVCIMADILTNIKRIRRAMLAGQAGVELTRFGVLDKEGLQVLAVSTSWRLPA